LESQIVDADPRRRRQDRTHRIRNQDRLGIALPSRLAPANPCLRRHVLINVAQFLYVKGSLALDIGSRETVTINTGIPASLGPLGSDALDAIRDALSNLQDDLGDLKADLKDQITDVIVGTLQAAIDGLVDDVVGSIVDTLKTELAAVVTSVDELTDEQLAAVVAAVKTVVDAAIDEVKASLSVDSLLDTLLSKIKDPVIALLPDPVAGPRKRLA
jgi:hypothetical protein